jgi:hypothetical protein
MCGGPSGPLGSGNINGRSLIANPQFRVISHSVHACTLSVITSNIAADTKEEPV